MLIYCWPVWLTRKPGSEDPSIPIVRRQSYRQFRRSSERKKLSTKETILAQYPVTKNTIPARFFMSRDRERTPPSLRPDVKCRSKTRDGTS